MQSDFDKILRENLKGYEADFNSADWQQMEKMLPEKSSKPYALLALLLLFVGIGGLLVGTGEFQKENNSTVIVGNYSSDESQRSAVADSKSEKTNSMEKTESPSFSGAKNPNAKEQNQSVGLNGKIKNEIVNQNDNARTPSPTGEGLFTHHSFSEGGGEVFKMNQKSSQVKLSEEKSKTLNTNPEVNSIKKKKSNPQSNPSQSASFSALEKIESLDAVSQSNNDETIFALTSIEAGIIKLNDEKNISERITLSDDATPKHKPKKQIVSFAFGGGAGVNFSFIDASRWTKPGYTVDIAQELLFVKRIGFAFTLGYIERKYDGGAYPCPGNTLDCPYAYSSTVRSVDLSAALKVNLINKTKWSWYVKTGIINTVKLKEEFDYSYPQTDTIMPPTLPPQTNFNGSGFSEAMQDNMGLNNSDHPSDLTISGVKRYHLAFHSAAGFDIALKPNMRLQVEAGHSFTQPTVGVEDKRLHTIGVNARWFYRFGR